MPPKNSELREETEPPSLRCVSKKTWWTQLAKLHVQNIIAYRNYDKI